MAIWYVVVVGLRKANCTNAYSFRMVSLALLPGRVHWRSMSEVTRWWQLALGRGGWRNQDEYPTLALTERRAEEKEPKTKQKTHKGSPASMFWKPNLVSKVITIYLLIIHKFNEFELTIENHLLQIQRWSWLHFHPLRMLPSLAWLSSEQTFIPYLTFHISLLCATDFFFNCQLCSYSRIVFLTSFLLTQLLQLIIWKRIWAIS